MSTMNPVEVDSDEDDDDSVSEQGETNKKNKNSATTAIIWKHRIATIAQNKHFVSNTFFDDSSDNSDGSDYMETRLKRCRKGGVTRCNAYKTLLQPLRIVQSSCTFSNDCCSKFRNDIDHCQEYYTLQ